MSKEPHTRAALHAYLEERVGFLKKERDFLRIPTNADGTIPDSPGSRRFNEVSLELEKIRGWMKWLALVPVTK